MRTFGDIKDTLQISEEAVFAHLDLWLDSARSFRRDPYVELMSTFGFSKDTAIMLVSKWRGINE